MAEEGPSEEAFEVLQTEGNPTGGAWIAVDQWEKRTVGGQEDVVFYRIVVDFERTSRQTWRRFSDFEALASQLKRTFPSSDIPKLFRPYLVRQKLIGEAQFLTQRAAKLQTYLRMLLQQDEVAGSFPFRAFLGMYDLRGKIGIVTGGNASVGLSTVELLAELGMTVVIASRSEDRGRAVVSALTTRTGDAERVQFMRLDANSLASVQQFVHQFRAKFDRLDLLVHNATVLAPAMARTLEGAEVHYGVNFLTQFALTQALLPQIEAAKGRIVFVSGSGHIQCKPEWLLQQMTEPTKPTANDLGAKQRAFQVSKLAIALYATELAARVSLHGACVFHCHNEPFDLGAQLQLFLAVHPGAEIHSGKYFQDFLAPSSGHPLLTDPGNFRERLWESTEEWVQKTVGST